MRIRIGNQTAVSAPGIAVPFEFAVEQGFDAFEWFPDRNEAEAGWMPGDLDREERARIRDVARAHDILLSVHAPWWANPSSPEATSVLQECADLARDIGASLLNLHLVHEQDDAPFARAVASLVERLASNRIRLSLENTPLTGPDECNAVFEALARCGLSESRDLGMCLDLGHANLCRATRNDYLGFMDRLSPNIPVIHVHLHENYGDADSHLTLFTGPAGRDPSGIEGLLRRLAGRDFSGCFILEQWPEPRTLLCDARNRLLKMMAGVPSGEARSPGGHCPAPPRVGGDRGSSAASAVPEAERIPARDFLESLAEADRRNRSWREKLAWVRDVLNDPETAVDMEKLVCLAVYLRFIGTGEVPCHEDGRHFRPSHHAAMAGEIADRLAAVSNSQNVHVVRRILPWLPSSTGEFTRSEPLTLIRDIAHRSDIPRELKTEIKHTLQNKLHRCAGPEDLVTASGLLARITASETSYAPAFVAEFRRFHEQLEEFFNARSLERQLEDMARELGGHDAELIAGFLDARARSADLPAQIRVLGLLLGLRERFHERSLRLGGPLRRQLQLVDVRLEEAAFVLLSELVNGFEEWRDARASGREPEAAASFWDWLLECLVLTVGNLRCGGFPERECRALEAELEAWRRTFDAHDHERAIRLKASLERARRLAEDHRDRVLQLFPESAARLGHALGVAEAAVKVYAESEIRGHLVFQLAKLIALSVKVLRGAAGLSPWETIVPGEAAGALVASSSLERFPEPRGPAVALIDRLQGDEEVPTHVTGVIVSHETPTLSHFAVRCRERGVVFVSCGDAESMSLVRSSVGRFVVLKASAEKVDITPSPVEGPNRAAARTQPAGTLRSPGAPKVELLEEPLVLPLDRATAENSGGKAYGARVLEELSGRAGANFQTPRSLVIPFGVMESLLRAQPSAEREFHSRLDLLRRLPLDDCAESLVGLQSIIRKLELPQGLVAEVTGRFGSDARLMVRSSSSCEDLDVIAGAGLYESVANVSAEGLCDAVREVWASLWSNKGAAGRRYAGLPHDRAFMAVLIQQLVAPDLSFILHTVDPVTRNPDELLVELVVGLGQTLASADRPGNPYRMAAGKLNGAIRMLAFANFSEALLPSAREGTSLETLDYSRTRFSIDAPYRESLGRELAATGKFVETAMGSPQDIEGVIAGETVTLVQSRPQQGISRT